MKQLGIHFRLAYFLHVQVFFWKNIDASIVNVAGKSVEFKHLHEKNLIKSTVASF